MRRLVSLLMLSFLVELGINAQISKANPTVKWDTKSLIMDGKRVVPVMGEIHYSRLPEYEWRKEIKKMKEGGVTMIATYVFWNHIEEIKDQFDWSGQRNLRHFLEICKEENLPVILRLGPFCHGEVRNGGFPDWVLTMPVSAGEKPMKTRSEDPRFLKLCEKLYRQIFTQVQGLQWKDGGPVLACQFDNEYRGRGSYLMALKKIAQNIGFDLPFYTRTGWPELATPVPYGEMLPLFGDYADGFWERSIQETAGNYYKAFFFKSNRDSKSIATEQFNYQQNGSETEKTKEVYPYFTCELGGGGAIAYHRRPYFYADDAYSLAVVKLGSGSNLLGYYMYHGGTNPEGKLSYLNENQRTKATNYNDLPVKTYDFHAPLGEFGQYNPAYFRLRPLHLFMDYYGETLAPLQEYFPNEGREVKKGDDSYLRWSYRSNGETSFVFFNNYERLQKLSAKSIAFKVGNIQLPKVTIPANAIGVFPVNVEGMKYATAQLVAKKDDKVYLMQIKGIPSTLVFQNGKTMKNVKPKGTVKPVYKNYYLLTEDEAEHLFLEKKAVSTADVNLKFEQIKKFDELRKITIGVQKVAEEPVDADFEHASVYTIELPTDNNGLLDIHYQGDCARLYADGKLIDDNFYNGRPFQYGLWRLPKGTTKLELRILPLQKDMPVYLPREADITPGEKVVSVKVISADTLE